MTASDGLGKLLGSVERSVELGLVNQARLLQQLDHKDEIIDRLLIELEELSADAPGSEPDLLREAVTREDGDPGPTRAIRRERALRLRAERDYHRLDRGMAQLVRSLHSGNESAAVIRRTLNVLGALYAFSQQVEAGAPGVTFDVVQAHDNFGLWAASWLAGRDEAPLIADLVEVTTLHERVGVAINSLPAAARRFIESKDHRIIRRADATFTVSTGLRDFLEERHRREVVLLRNTRYYSERPAAIDLRERYRLPPDMRIVSYANRIGPDMGIFELIDALPLMRHQAALVCIGKFTNDATESAVRAYAQESGLSDQIVFIDQMAQHRYVQFLAGSDVGSNAVKPLNRNLKVSLPNRVFDYIAARVPIVTSNVGDSGRVVERYRIGEVFEEVEATSIATALDRALDKGASGYGEQLENAATELSWERESEPYLNAVKRLARGDGSSPRRVAIVARKPVLYNNRLFQQAKLLGEHGFEVTVFSLSGFATDLAERLPPTVREVVIPPPGEISSG